MVKDHKITFFLDPSLSKIIVDMRRHSKTCKIEKIVYDCDVCGKAFNSKNHYNVHIITHQNSHSYYM